MVAVPSAAAAAGYTSLVFDDDFTNPSDIASSESATSGYNWYWSFSVGSFITPNSWSINPTETAAQVTNGNSGGGDNASPNGGILQLDSVRGSKSGFWGNSTLTTVPDNLSSVPSQGAWQYGYFEAYVQYDPNALGYGHSYTQGYPAFWSWGAEGAQNFGDWRSSLNATVTEADFLEDFSGVTWANGGTDPTGAEAGTIMNPAGVSAAYSVGYPKSDANWHTIGFLWTPSTISFYRDNVLVGSHSTAGWPLDNTHLFMILGTGVGWPMNVDWVHVWQGGTAPPPPAPPPAPTALDLAAASDTGVSNTDNITSIVAPTFTGNADAGDTVTLYDGTTVIGTGIGTAGGTWSITASTLANGAHGITATATDSLGNVSVSSSVLSVTIDTVAPAAPQITGGTASNLKGTGEPGATVTILDGTSTVGTATVTSGGSWSWSFTASKATRSLTAVQTDKAGNRSPVSNETAQVGTSGANTLTSTASNELLIGGAGADTFLFGPTFGLDVIADFAASGFAHDVIDFHGNPVLNSFANVMSHAVQVGSGVVITSDAQDTLTINNVTRSSLTSSDFRFV
jgi:Bacterial Ig-like domain/Bacterial Ig domain